MSETLKDLKGWLVWKYVDDGKAKKPRKIPYYVDGGVRVGGQGGERDRSRLASFAQATATLQTGQWTGLGFCMLPDWGLVGLDFDNCVDDTGALLPEVEALVAGTYAEWSPSRRGVHAFMRGAIADRKSNGLSGTFGFEAFCGTGFLTFTGDVLPVCQVLGAEVCDLTQEVLALYGTRFPGASTRLAALGDVDPLVGLVPTLGLSDDEVREILAAQDPGCDYLTWLNIGMALHHETSGAERGLDLWDAWSALGASYPGRGSLEVKWDGFGRNLSRAPVTMRSVRKVAMRLKYKDDVVLDPKDVVGTARRLVDTEYQGDESPAILRAAGLWYGHAGPNWEELPDEEVRAAAWKWLDRAKKDGKDGAIIPFQPAKGQVDSLLDALKAVTIAPKVQAPCWLPGHTGADPKDLISLSNGMLHIESRRLLAHTSAYFTLNSLPFAWDDDCEPVNWKTFLNQAFEGDSESQEALQEMFGYLLTSDTSQQKMFLIVGPKRSGKGTIGRVLGALVGRSNMVSPTLSSLTSNFGLQPLIDKLVALVPDARVGGQTNTQAIVERLLMVSGEDDITVDRKNRTAWSGKMTARFVMLTNELPKLGDASGALTSRFITLVMRNSFYGREDQNLTEKLMQELPAIFRWALDGLDRLRNRGHFIQPKSALEEVEEMCDLNSPVILFTKECCEFGFDFSCSIDDLYSAWRSWSQGQGIASHTSKQIFGRSIHAAHPTLRRFRPRVEGAQIPHYHGIRVSAASMFA